MPASTNTGLQQQLDAILDKHSSRIDFANDLKSLLQNIKDSRVRLLGTFTDIVVLPVNANTNFYSLDIPAGALASNGDTLELEYHIEYTSITNEAPALKIQFAGTTIFSLVITGNLNYSYGIFARITRVSNTEVKVVAYSAYSISNQISQFTTISNLNLSTTQYALNGRAEFTANVSGSAKFGSVKVLYN